jgi:two-component system, NarL family, nitrate/nitrite response regulator NarL
VGEGDGAAAWGDGPASSGGGAQKTGFEPATDARGQCAPIRVLIVSDVRLYRESLSTLLGPLEQIAVVGTARSADDAVERVPGLNPDVVLLDTGQAGNAAAAHALLAPAPNARVVVIATPESEEDVIALAEAGVLGYVTRDQSLDDLIRTIQSVARDEMVCSPWMATVLVKRVQALAAQRPRPLHRLTTREAEILALVGEGLSNKQIAARLFIEVTTVKNHVHSILEKLGVRRREEAVASMEMGLATGLRSRRDRRRGRPGISRRGGLMVLAM